MDTRDTLLPPAAFVHLHVHSYFSFLDGASSPQALVERAAAMDQECLALTDWNGVYGAVAFDHAARRTGLRPIFGAEIALDTVGDTPGAHLTLLVKNSDGWRSLCRLLTSAQLRGRKGRAPVPAATLAEHASGLVCLSGCRRGALAAPLLANDEARAWEAAIWLRDLYGDDLWIELPRNDLPDDRLLSARLAGLAARLGIGVVATANVHYALSEGPLADVLACIRTGTALAAARNLRPNHAFHLASGAEMAARVADCPEAVANARLVAAQCDFALDFGPHVFPSVPLPDGQTPDDHLRALCRAGLSDRYSGSDPALWRRAARQLDHELAIIRDLGLAQFFLVVADVVLFARERGIPCQGRGSAVGSVTAYSLGISRVEPLSHRLLFERFLSRERGSLPDIDLDLGHSRREEVIQFLYRKYGTAHVAMASTAQTYRRKGAVRDVGKALGIPAPVLEAVALRVRQHLDDTLAEAVIAAVGEAALGSPVWGNFVSLCEQIIGVPRHLGLHNGGMVITGPPLSGRVPLEHATMPGRVCVQWGKDSLEMSGLIKLDLLSLQSLDMVQEAVRLAALHEGVAIDLDRLPLDDPATYGLLRSGDTIGAFQVESRAQQNVAPLHQPRNFLDIVVQISIIRPGPIQSGMVHPYLRRRLGEERVTYLHPSLEPVLRDTYGVVLWQEQVLELARALAGLSLAEGDELRRAMGSQRSPVRMAALRERFLAGAARNGVAEATAEEAFRQVEAFSGYGFPRSHAVAFARLAYETMFLRTHHLVCFVAARLNAQPGGFYSPRVIVGDARRHGVTVLGPDLSRSDYDCSVERQGDRLVVRLGLRYVRKLAKVTGTAVVAERERGGPFRDLADLCLRAHAFLSPKAITALIASGACDGWGKPRRHLLWALPAAWKEARGLALPVASVELPPESPPERLAGEIWATGLPIGGSPVALHRAALASLGAVTAAGLENLPTGVTAILAGQVAVMQSPPTAKGVMFLSVEDETGLGNAVLTTEVLRHYRAALHAGPLVLLTGTVRRKGPVVSLQVIEVAPWWPGDVRARSA
jgi:error-prone DNA polymerase